MTPAPNALQAVRILDLSRVLAGPACTQLLGDLGADVIKIERPGAGDDTRQWGPPYLKDGQGQDTTESAYYLSANRNKRSVAVDISKPEGQALIRRLLEGCDILVENFKVGDLARFGLDWASLKQEFPRLIYCSVTGFGQDGPYAQRPGYDYLAQGMGGIMSLTGEIGGQPMKTAVAISDLMAGMYAAVAILAALRHRDATGQGQRIDISLLDCQVAWLSYQAQHYLTSGAPPPRLGNGHPSIVPYEVFAASDGHLILAVGNESQFVKFCALAGRPELATDPRFATNRARVLNRETLVPLIGDILKQRRVSDWLEALAEAGVPSGPVNRIDQVFEDAQVKHRQMVCSLDHPLAPAPVQLVASPIKMEATPPSYRHAPPTLGQHTKSVLRDLGLDEADISGLRTKGII
ncbi:MAG: CoA transferase [Alphaproteobacteria bacterium]|nr:CoA transferase [Alphaproteobacteria bacterium]